MATKCEGCLRRNPKTYERGPFKGQTQDLDYCKYCSMDLCDDCMERLPCENSPTLTHTPEDEDE